MLILTFAHDETALEKTFTFETMDDMKDVFSSREKRSIYMLIDTFNELDQDDELRKWIMSITFSHHLMVATSANHAALRLGNNFETDDGAGRFDLDGGFTKVSSPFHAGIDVCR